MSIRTFAGTALTAMAVVWAGSAAYAQPIPVNLHVGDFTYQFADPTSGQPINTLVLSSYQQTARISVYLIQTGGTPPNVLQQLGAEGLGVRLDYAGSFGSVKVANTSFANITPRPPPVNNPNGKASDFDLVQRTGAGTGTDTTSSAAIVDGLVYPDDPLPFPGTEDPLGIKTRMLIGRFTLQMSSYAWTPVQVSALDPFLGTQSISGPNPTINRIVNDWTNGPLPGNGFNGEVLIDQYLTQYLPTPVIPTLTVFTPVPEPNSLVFGILAAAGLLARRRRMAQPN